MFTTFAGLFKEEHKAVVATHEKVIDIPLLRAATNIDPNPAKGGGEIIVDAGALVPDSGPFGGTDSPLAKDSNSNGEITAYVVRDGDSLSQIAKMFGVTTKTILWANEIKKASSIKPGDTLIILPITGVRHVVKDGDTIQSIAKKYGGDAGDILAYNQLESEEDILPGDTIVIPGGEVEEPKVVVSIKKPIKTGVIGRVLSEPRMRGDDGDSPDLGGPTLSRSGFLTNPVPGAVKTQGIHGYNGVDLGAPVGMPVFAAASGDVILSRNEGYNGGYGKYIVIKHPNGTQTLYGHLSSNIVDVGIHVGQGQRIGSVGSTGRSTGPHLHFEVRGGKNPF